MTADKPLRRLDPNSTFALRSGAVDGPQRQIKAIAGAINDADGKSVVILVLDDGSRVGLWDYHLEAIEKCASELP